MQLTHRLKKYAIYTYNIYLYIFIDKDRLIDSRWIYIEKAGQKKAGET